MTKTKLTLVPGSKEKARIAHLVDRIDTIMDRVSKDMQKVAKIVEELQELT